MKDSVKITVYRWAGEKWFLRIEGECIECDLTVSQVRTLVARNPDWPIEWEIKPWLSHLWESLRRGGWHPPVVLVDGKLVRQGTIPTLAELQAAVRLAFEAKGIVVKENRSASLQRVEPTEEGVGLPVHNSQAMHSPAAGLSILSGSREQSGDLTLDHTRGRKFS